MNNKPLSYPGYLQIETLLSCQQPVSGGDGGAPAHDEMLFIVVHQVYELWFKQILHELDSVIALFRDSQVDDTSMGTAVARMERVAEIQKVLIDQIRVLETMTALDFLDFRDALFPASGFQSVQFRLVETKLGLRPSDRVSFSSNLHTTMLESRERDSLSASESSASLFDVIERWLERTPFLDFGGFRFWPQYGAAVDAMLASSRLAIEDHPELDAEGKEEQLKQLSATRASFDALLDAATHEAERRSGRRRLSHRATQAALFIYLYSHYPVLQVPHRLLTLLVEIDEDFTAWRQRHALMAHRMIGRKIGTGGSLGYRYLKAAAEKHKVFSDLFDISTYLIPRSALPALPDAVAEKLGFRYRDK